MKTAAILFPLYALLLACLPLARAAQGAGKPVAFPDISGLKLALYSGEADTAGLHMYPIEADTAYLQPGQLAGRTFAISQIKARIVIIEVFTIYCPHCQQEAPLVNKLYEFIKSNKLDREIKIIGVGYESSDFGLKVFRFTYGIQFPLFSDLQGATCKVLGAESMPSYYVVRLDKKSCAKIVYATVKSLTSPDDFLDKVFASSQ
jgi:thiol-disulfide isomerase/thioredoxin